MTLQTALHILLWQFIFFISVQIVLRLVRRINKFPVKSRLGKLFYDTLLFERCEEG